MGCWKGVAVDHVPRRVADASLESAYPLNRGLAVASLRGPAAPFQPLQAVQVSCKSAPAIESDVKVKANPAPAVFSAISDGGAPQLKHVETVDRSAPAIEKDTKVAPSPRALRTPPPSRPRPPLHFCFLALGETSGSRQKWEANGIWSGRR